MSIDLSGRCILIVEDEPLIAMDIATNLKSANASVVVAATLDQGMRFAEERTFSAAVLDLRLGGDDATALCTRFSERGVPFVLYTGHTDVPAACTPAAIVWKPAPPEALLRAVAAAIT